MGAEAWFAWRTPSPSYFNRVIPLSAAACQAAGPCAISGGHLKGVGGSKAKALFSPVNRLETLMGHRSRETNQMKRIASAVAIALLALTISRAVESIELGFRSETASLFSSEPCRHSSSGHAERIPFKPIAAPRDDSLVVPASFLLFDFKQNLRQWPNVSGDISRSPPFCAPL